MFQLLVVKICEIKIYSSPAFKSILPVISCLFEHLNKYFGTGSNFFGEKDVRVLTIVGPHVAVLIADKYFQNRKPYLAFVSKTSKLY